MKNLIAAMIIIGMSTYATAQDIEAPENSTPKIKKHEIGFTSEIIDFGGSINNSTLQALQFKKWKNEHYGARFLIGRATFQSDRNFPTTYITNNDTITKNMPLTFAQMGFVGVGLEAQRQFYKRIYLFAAVEGRFGFGKASVDTIQERVTTSGRYVELDPATRQPFPNRPTLDAFQAALTPTFGAKFQFSRVTFGSEMAWNIFNYTQVGNPGSTLSSFDLDMSRMGARFFVHYRF